MQLLGRLLIRVVLDRVSILTGPEGPVQHLSRAAAWAEEGFQSSPGPKARCNTDISEAINKAVAVSILTGPEGPVQLHHGMVDRSRRGGVSILTGPEGPVQRTYGLDR